MKLHTVFLIPLLLCSSLSAMDQMEGSSSTSSSSSDEEHAVQMPQERKPTARELEQKHINRSRKNKKIAAYIITALLVAGVAVDIGSNALAPVTGRNAVPWNISKIPGCSYNDAVDCSLVVNQGICKQICKTNQEEYTTRLSNSGNPFSANGIDNCYLLQNCPEEAQSYVILAALSLTTRVLTIFLPIWLCCAE